jgi:non-specific serine/threonine protein kinase
VLEHVGAGGFGDVYRAFDPLLQREVALKLRRLAGEEEAQQFDAHLEEARCLARVRHQNVLAVYGIETHDGQAGMWTDYISGETLEQSLARGPFPLEELIQVGSDLCRALAAVHDAGLIHGDIKTSNAMRDRDGRTILMDFGAGSDRRSALGSPQGTPLAMAPELLRGQKGSPSSDLYSLGVLLYRLATARYPIEATDWSQLLGEHERREIITLSEARPDLPATIAKAIERVLSEDPDDRPATASELQMMLASASPGIEPAAAVGASAAGVGALPRPSTRFVGRRAELLAVRRLLVDPGLVTLTGPGGAGKTRLAHRVALDLAGGMPDGIAWIDLSGVLSPQDFAPAIVRALSLAERVDRDDEETVCAALSGRAMLIVLDNCEQVLSAAARFVTMVLVHAPKSRVLATSRECLGLPEERRFVVSPLGVPDGAESPADVARSEAVRLFVDRACRRRPDFLLTPESAPAIARIVRRVDGVPLAIELAASRVGALTVEQIADRLDDSFRLLTSRDSGALPRQQTLRASIEWSYRFLTADEARLLDRLSVFAGGFTLEAAEAVCPDGPTLTTGILPDQPAHAVAPLAPSGRAGLGEGEVVDLLESLVDRSLVEFDERGRYRLLEMVRSFASDRLHASGEGEAWRDRHLLWCRALAGAAERKLIGPETTFMRRSNGVVALPGARIAIPRPGCT